MQEQDGASDQAFSLLQLPLQYAMDKMLVHLNMTYGGPVGRALRHAVAPRIA